MLQFVSLFEGKNNKAYAWVQQSMREFMFAKITPQNDWIIPKPSHLRTNLVFSKMVQL